jgi:uncharacterized protein YkwD
VLDDVVDTPRSRTTAERNEKPFARVAITLRNHADTAVGKVPGDAHEAEFQRSRPRPPAETDALDASVDPRGDPHGGRGVCAHTLLGYGPVISIGRRGATLLLATTAGALLAGGVAMAAPQLATQSGEDGLAAAVVALTNAERQQAGCSDVTVDDRLTAAAQGHADDMAANDYLEHVSQDGREFNDRVRAAGYPSPGGENIAQGYGSAPAVMKAWMESSGHRENIVNCEYATIGIGYVADGDYWVQDFGR